MGWKERQSATRRPLMHTTGAFFFFLPPGRPRHKTRTFPKRVQAAVQERRALLPEILAHRYRPSQINMAGKVAAIGEPEMAVELVRVTRECEAC